MVPTTGRVSEIILDQLAGREMRLLSLIVNVRKALGDSARVKGDLSDAVKSSLRQLLAARTVVDVDGVYSRPPAQAKASIGNC